ncbi:hypothetical protein ACG83_17615 [Frankia sp. R43]|nr:hypothetical protein ACG83_17615 [Frankia sp. R43]
MDADAYSGRLRSLIAAAIEICMAADFEHDDVSEDGLPSWFLNLSDGSEDEAYGDAVGSAGKSRYLEVRDDRAWDAGEWIYCFDPDLRKWSWWDITVVDDGVVCVWVDTKGEAHIPCEELWWAVFVAGAQEVQTMTLETSSIWSQQDSVGLRK